VAAEVYREIPLDPGVATALREEWGRFGFLR
jgi:hypothetical protein